MFFAHLAKLRSSFAALWFDVVWTFGAAHCVHVYDPRLEDEPTGSQAQKPSSPSR